MYIISLKIIFEYFSTNKKGAEYERAEYNVNGAERNRI
jgi:hypothetical protein